MKENSLAICIDQEKLSPPTALYVHIPFCPKKCHYCDFVAFLPRSASDFSDYVEALLKEAEMVVQENPPQTLKTIFFGGGTPTLLSPQQLLRLGEGLKSIFSISEDSEDALEWTVEGNPETLLSEEGEERLAVLRSLGVNRISLGAQAFSNKLLEKLGRIHGVEAIQKAVEKVRQAGWDNFSLDLMFGLPEQSLQDWKYTLKQAIELSPKHLSCYHLSVEKGTSFYHWRQQGRLLLPEEDDVYAMYQWARSELVAQGYDQYEVSNFCIPGYECRHNVTYWENRQYYALGTGAAGYVQGIRTMNVSQLRPYIDQTEKGMRPLAEKQEEPCRETMENFFIMGLRLKQGVDIQDFRHRYGQDPEQVFPGLRQEWEEKGLLVVQGTRWILTEQGLLQGNLVFSSFLGMR